MKMREKNLERRIERGEKQRRGKDKKERIKKRQKYNLKLEKKVWTNRSRKRKYKTKKYTE